MKVFDLLFHEFRDKSGDTIDFVFVQKDSVGVQKKRECIRQTTLQILTSRNP